MDQRRSLPRAPGLIVLALGLLSAAPGAAAEPATAPRGWLDPLRYRDAAAQAVAGVQRLECVEMGRAIVNGSDMGPGDGWFHSAQSRYGWEWLGDRPGIGPTGTVTGK